MSSPQATIASPFMSLEAFVEHLKRLSPEQIAEIPVERLPENIPADISERVPLASRGAVDDLLMASNAFHLRRRIHDHETFGDDVVDALDRAKESADNANIRVFKDKILTLIQMLQEAKAQSKSFTIVQFVTNITNINYLLIDVRSEQVSLYKAALLLKQTPTDKASDGARFKAALSRLQGKVETIEKLLAEYYVLRLRVLAKAIHQKRKQIEAQEENGLVMRQEIQDLRDQMGQPQTLWRRTLKRGKVTEDQKRLQARIEELVYRIKANEVVIAENELILWLDAIVDASLNKRSLDRVGESLRNARISLYHLLNKFCATQEESALQIAQNPFLQVDPKKAISFVLKSEQFILDYFSKKKNETTAWLSGAAQSKIDDLDRLQKDILQELRRSGHTRRLI